MEIMENKTELKYWIKYTDSGKGLYEVLIWCEKELKTDKEKEDGYPKDGWADTDAIRRFQDEDSAREFMDVIINLKRMDSTIRLNHIELHKYESYDDDASSDCLEEWSNE